MMADSVDAQPPPGMNSTQCDPGKKLEQMDTTDSFAERTYKLNKDSEHRGIALIINNMDFKKLQKREGSEKDVAIMENVLKKFRFSVLVHKNLAVHKMKDLFLDIQNDSPQHYDCFVAVIMSHGGDGDIIYGSDDETVELNELLAYLLPEKCPSLVGKPKLFFVQACRGSMPDKGTEVPDAIESPSIKIPTWADVMIHHSTVPGYYSWKRSSGSWFIQSLGKVLEKYGDGNQKKELTEMLTMVNCKVAKDYESNPGEMKQMPVFSSMLTRKFYFM